MVNSNALVSIIVPVYGTEAYLPACIDSILNQSYQNLQIILVDDQSPDCCPEICDRYSEADSRIIVIHQKNKGVSGARNTGLQYATGEYILFVDSDDMLFPKAVEILVQDARGYNADIVWAPQKKQAKETDDYDEGSYTVYRGTESLLLSLNGEHNINAVWGKLFRTESITGLSFEEGKHINEDGFFMFQCYLRQPLFLRHNVSVYRYSINPNSASRQRFSAKYLSMLYFCDRKKELVSRCYPQYMEQVHNMEVRTNLQMLDVLCRIGEQKNKTLEKQCIQTIRRLYHYHKPINKHHKLLAGIVKHGLYPVYKWAVRMKYYR